MEQARIQEKKFLGRGALYWRGVWEPPTRHDPIMTAEKDIRSVFTRSAAVPS